MGKRKQKDEGTEATNRDTIEYEQVHKEQSYRLAESESEELFDEEFTIRTCDIDRTLRGNARDRENFAEELGSALREIGFAVLVGHGIDSDLFAACHAETERVFTEHSLEEKMRFRARRHGSINEGYFPMEETTDIHPDLVEGWVFARRAFGAGCEQRGEVARVRDFWPNVRHERPFRKLCLAQERLIKPIAGSMLTYLGCNPRYLDAKLTGTNFALRLNYYPPIEKASEAGRLLGHEDVDLFTLLPAPRSEGLQVLNRKNSRWVRLEAPKDALILNVGDYMQRISNDTLPSTTHRVSQPREAAGKLEARVSFPMNVYLWEDEILEVLPGIADPHYGPIRALEFHTRTTAKYYGDDYGDDYGVRS